MISKTFKYTDYNGVEREETHWFNFTQAEITKMEFSVDGGFSERLKRIISAKKQTELFPIIEQFVLEAYGVKSPDGRKFIKNDEVREDFKSTEMFSQLVMELVTNDEAAAEFIIGVSPNGSDKQKIREALNEQINIEPATVLPDGAK